MSEYEWIVDKAWASSFWYVQLVYRKYGRHWSMWQILLFS